MEENNRKELCDKIYHMAKKKMPFNEIVYKITPTLETFGDKKIYIRNKNK